MPRRKSKETLFNLREYYLTNRGIKYLEKMESTGGGRRKPARQLIKLLSQFERGESIRKKTPPSEKSPLALAVRRGLVQEIMLKTAYPGTSNEFLYWGPRDRPLLG